MALDLQAMFARSERAYERGRARHATVLAIPLAALSLVAGCLGARPATAGIVGLVLLAATWFFLWRGQALGRSVFPGILAGLIPLSLAVSARSYGHVCTGGRCVSMCIPACAVGGVLAGFFIARAARHAASRGRFVFGASALAVLVGSLGCSCVGYGGLAGLSVGLLVILLPVALTPGGANG